LKVVLFLPRSSSAAVAALLSLPKSPTLSENLVIPSVTDVKAAPDTSLSFENIKVAKRPKAPKDADKLPDIKSARGASTSATTEPTCKATSVTVAANLEND
jgi:hypothetical protein